MILVIPDVHGRDYWREPCKNLDKYAHVVFLGDYLDPYGFEQGDTEGSITLASTLAGFLDIVSLAEANRGKVTLLLGNHDLHYIDNSVSMSSRYNEWMAEQAGPVFAQRRDLFSLACEFNGTLFTHAGCLQGWLDEANGKYPDLQLEMSADSLNSLLSKENGLRALGMVSDIRGGWNRHGSCVWADVSEHLNVTSAMTQVFGHTQQVRRDRYNGTVEYLNEVVRESERWMMLDCARAFELDELNPFQYHRIPNPKIDNGR